MPPDFHCRPVQGGFHGNAPPGEKAANTKVASLSLCTTAASGFRTTFVVPCKQTVFGL